VASAEFRLALPQMPRAGAWGASLNFEVPPVAEQALVKGFLQNLQLLDVWCLFG